MPLKRVSKCINPSNAELNPICHVLALLGAHHILHVSRIRVNKLSQRFFFNSLPWFSMYRQMIRFVKAIELTVIMS